MGTYPPKNEKVLKLLERALKESHKDEIDFNESERAQLNTIIKKADERMERVGKWYKRSPIVFNPSFFKALFWTSSRRKLSSIRSLSFINELYHPCPSDIPRRLGLNQEGRIPPLLR